ncbi:RHS repeat-associated core domain-containing protein [Bacteroidales bacterium OttesenSCG-928-M06]|nr:RHS repeat-associated core domain-containing protein [Bacteroidales bacterium OttesenSCG-928-M06]
MEKNRGIEKIRITENRNSLMDIFCIVGRSKSLHYTYDEWDRVVSIKDSVEQGKVFTTSHQYDKLGRVNKEIYPSGYFITNNYDSYGNLINIMDANKDSIWTVKEITAKGQILRTRKGNKETNFAYDDRGFPTRIHTPGVMDMNYGFTEQGNLDFRKDGLTDYEELFEYDNFNRLSGWHIIHERKGILDSYGMDYTPGKTTIRSKSGYGSNLSYGINGTKPHALASFQPGSGQTLNPIQHITYTDFKKVKRLSIFEGTTYLDITYGVDEQRIKSVYGTPSGATTRYYLGSYEEEIVNGNIRKIHYLSAGDGLVAIYVQNSGSQDSLYHAYTDYQGSLIAVTDKGGNLREHYAYDAWGLRRNPDDWTKNDTRTAFLFTRGYTFHEHIPEFNLINMNGRIYDPGVGLFFSPDPYIQAPGDWLNYNRYTYCMNNPLIYTDPSGEFIFGYFTGFFKGLFKGKNPFKEGWKGGVNEVKIWGGLFVSDSNKNFGGRLWEVVSRFTWQLPQTLIGTAYSHISNYAGQVDKVDYWGGATVLKGNNWDKKAVTLGSFIIGDRTIAADPHNPLFQHEYGHYLQSQSMGWGYLTKVGLPSLFSAGKEDGTHRYKSFEQDANRRAFIYFNENVDGFYQTQEEYGKNQRFKIEKGWNFRENPLDIYGNNENYYRDYKDKDIRDLINNLCLSSKWYDYAWRLLFPLQPFKY